MKTLRWEISATEEFNQDVALSAMLPGRLSLMCRNIERHPMIGKPVEEVNGVACFDYTFGDHVVRYILIPETRQIFLMTLRAAVKADENHAEKVRKARQLLDDISKIVGIIKP